MTVEFCCLVTVVLLLVSPRFLLGSAIQECLSPLGMENGHIKDSQLAATSSSHGTFTGANNARLNSNVGYGGWCPDQKKYENKTGPFYDQYIQVKLDSPVRIKGITTQGRGKGGKEKVEVYWINYSHNRSKLNSCKWMYDEVGNLKSFIGNYAADKIHTSYIIPPIVANGIRIVPEIYPSNQVCLRFELLGCTLKDGLVSYSMPQGNVRGGKYNFTDASYDGTNKNQFLSSGLGMLTDGKLAPSDYIDNDGLGWIGWRVRDTPDPFIIFEFLQTRIFHSVTLHCNVRDRTKIQLPAKVVASFNVDGVSYDASLTYEPENVTSGHVWKNHNVTVDLCRHIGKFVKLNFTYLGDWILISEVTFNSEPLGSKVPPDLYCTPATKPPVLTSSTIPGGTPTGSTSSSNDSDTGAEAQAGGNSMDGGVIAGIICTVLAVLLAVALFICCRRKPHWFFKRQTPFNTFIKVELKPYSQYQAPQRVSRLESTGSEGEEKRYSFKNNIYHDSAKGTGTGGEATDVTACPIYASIQDNLNNEACKNNKPSNHANCSLLGTDKKPSKKANKPHIPPPLKPVQSHQEALYSEPTSPLLPPPSPSPSNSPKPPIPPRASQLDFTGDVSDSGYAEPDSPTNSAKSVPTSSPPPNPTVQAGYAEPIDVIGSKPVHIFSNPIYEEVYAEPYQGVSGTSLYCNPHDDLNFRARLDTFKDFPRNKLHLKEKIGDGQFGEVHIGEVENLGEILGEEFKKGKRVTVAIKTLKVNVEKNIKEDFFKEVKVMAGLRHTNVVRLLGVCRDDPMCMIVEYMVNGDLNQFLKEKELAPGVSMNEGMGGEGEGKLVPTQALLYMGQQVAAGMKYISSLNYVHRDLATRNCLVGHAYTVKIADFGMSRNLYSRHYYRIEGRVILPIRWMAPECILQGRFTTSSDVWAYGVTLWEILTLAQEYPYSQFTDEQVIANVQKMYHQSDDASFSALPQPENCSDDLYQLMTRCWAKEPEDRPCFGELHSSIAGLVRLSEITV